MSGKFQAVLLMTVMYLLGVVSGLAWQSYHWHHFHSDRAMFAERRVHHMASELHLSPAQEQAIREIFQKAHERASQVNEEVAWDLEDIHRDSVDAIRQVLTPDQRVQFEKMHKKFHLSHPHWANDVVPSSGTAKATS